jgi:hypothetical protein
LLLAEGATEAEGFRHTAAAHPKVGPKRRSAQRRQRWVINKLRALGSWYTKGVDHGSRLRVAINHAESLDELRAIIRDFFLVVDEAEPAPVAPFVVPVGQSDSGEGGLPIQLSGVPLECHD